MSEKKHIRKEAVALSYHKQSVDAPKIVAKGKGQIAENIIAKAEKHGVPIQEDANLVELLGQLQLNDTIPEELYQAVAEVFAYIYRLDQAYEEQLKK